VIWPVPEQQNCGSYPLGHFFAFVRVWHSKGEPPQQVKLGKVEKVDIVALLFATHTRFF
jgi:hypothetical protein